MNDLECPYCEHEQDRLHEMECSNCDKAFVFTTSIMFSYEGFQADCLTTGKHIWKRGSTYPYEWTTMNCKTCEESRNLVESEWLEFEKKLGQKITGGRRE